MFTKKIKNKKIFLLTNVSAYIIFIIDVESGRGER